MPGRTLVVGAEDVLASARLATTLRRRSLTAAGSWERPDAAGSVRHHWTPRPSLRRPPGGRERVVLVFGDERTGLRRDELARCHALTRIPSDTGQPSLNLAQAVRVYAYAISRGPERRVRGAPRQGTDADLRRLEGVLEDVLRTTRLVRPGRAGVAPLVDPWRRSGLTRAEIRLWESAIRMLARSLSELSHDRHLRVQQNR